MGGIGAEWRDNVGGLLVGKIVEEGVDGKERDGRLLREGEG